jgi:CRISPR/Cas system-associated endonuclease Cas1
LVCDLQELYRHLIDDFLVQYCRRLRKKDFTTKAESVSKKRMGKREYLDNQQTRDLMKRLNQYFEREVEVPRIRVGKRQTIETLISEEALLLAKFLRDEQRAWVPRIAVLS